MINFSVIPQDSLIGKCLRGILKLIPKNVVLPILQGKLRGKKWIIGSWVFGYWFGTYELEKQKLFEKIVKEGDIVYDIGAHVGFYTLLASELVGERGKVFAFEPLPRNLYFFKKHTVLNSCSNIEIIEAAVSDKEGRVSFSEGESSFTGKLNEEGRLKVISITLDDLLKEGKILPPNIIKIDVEGAEYQVLKGAFDILKKYKPALILSIHNVESFTNCISFLEGLNYQLESIDDENYKKSGEVFAYQKQKNEKR